MALAILNRNSWVRLNSMGNLRVSNGNSNTLGNDYGTIKCERCGSVLSSFMSETGVQMRIEERASAAPHFGIRCGP
jgi:hypothetical protein